MVLVGWQFNCHLNAEKYPDLEPRVFFEWQNWSWNEHLICFQTLFNGMTFTVGISADTVNQISTNTCPMCGLSIGWHLVECWVSIGWTWVECPTNISVQHWLKCQLLLDWHLSDTHIGQDINRYSTNIQPICNFLWGYISQVDVCV